jgi:hypothetical protein
VEWYRHFADSQLGEADSKGERTCEVLTHDSITFIDHGRNMDRRSSPSELSDSGNWG